MRTKLDLTGQVYGRLTVIKEVEPYISPNGNKAFRWLCKCECGTEKEIQLSNLRSGTTTSCGCYQKEKVAETKTTHGLRKHPLYKIWIAIKQRTTNPKCKAYPYYGGRGISMYEPWLNAPELFIDYIESNLGDKLSSKYSIDRINNDGNYEPNNLRWATRTVQKINQRVNNRNTSGITGVYWAKASEKWIAQIRINKKAIHLGLFSNINDAIAARLKAEEIYHKPLIK
ncbi:MAG: AP2 domain-containing protein [Hydrococcus sp. SU_1_0]|nr:AP2 domain-containing protein [Hydrococcus sp. SU_1_0]